MATLPLYVQPGDVVSSELINAILEALAKLQVAPGGTQVVPNLLGAALSDARAILAQPARQLSLGFTVDVSGASVEPFAAANANLMVLNQSPAADARVAPNSPVNLVLSRSSSGGGTPIVLPPVITRTETATGTASTSFAVGGSMAIVGTDFGLTAAQNTVTFDGQPAASVVVDPANSTRRLIIVVPTGISGAPVNPGDPAKTGVALRVQTAPGVFTTTTITVTAPIPTQPTITSVDPITQTELLNITINGTNFGSAPQVQIRGTQATIVGTPTATQIVAMVPNFADINQGSLVASSLVVTGAGGLSVTFTGTFRVRGA